MGIKKRRKAIAVGAGVGASLLLVIGICFWLFSLSAKPVYQPEQSFTSLFQNFADNSAGMKFPEDLALYNLQGRKKTIDDFGKRYRLINFWATWCPPCINEIPTLKTLNKYKGGDNFIVLFVSMDYPDDGTALKQKMDGRGIAIDNPLFVKDYNVWETLGIKGLPVTILVDPRGRILYTMSGDIDWAGGKAINFLNNVMAH